MLETADIIKKVRLLELRSRKLASDVFSGEYHSAFKGKGMSFKEVREYAAGDDIRFIDWNVSARFGHPFSKVFEEERELTVMLLVDISLSTNFGTVYARKRDLATELAAVLAFSAVNNGDKIGVIFYSDKVEGYIPPKKGRQHALYIVRQLLTKEPVGKGTEVTQALRYFTNATRQVSIAFVLSDFLDGVYEDALRVASKKHDIIGLKLYDHMDMELPAAGLMEVQDAETGERRIIDSSSKYVRYQYQQEFFKATEYATQTFRKAGADLLHVKTGDDYVKVLQRFFLSRHR
ncbi:MAG: hypothetical protein ABS85_04225 [Sphingobacteriales bacterium SCN 48-20]|jgi:uncharacterized protein (DUF58 family)|uniref:DUF58 domain-containing protein n=1 Tax=Terrimonas ferruginea TaxID=249 RepID=UPI00086F6A91|nr:DUF58 domain-containing protein [Terrimonas ferruginea]MBN8782559.1 DUF58 domain-containing protein [Terrimonas ferruginea]ODT94110.1 MAG: hypothetical protein ABS85_04225 [Sphingobacteriales bacterium SCN 48-20]OJW43062.1 MAG: hypothetical protein BGO56_13650 [Sphingobacteriales bacterium 48-107]